MHDSSNDHMRIDPRDSFLVQLDHQIRTHAQNETDLREQMDGLLSSLETEERILTAALELHRRLTGSKHTMEDEFRASLLITIPGGTARPHTASGRQKGATHSVVLGPVAVPARGRLREIYDILEAAGKPVRLSDLVQKLVDEGLLDRVDNPTPATAAALSRGVKIGIFDRVGRGLYRARHTEENGE